MSLCCVLITILELLPQEYRKVFPGMNVFQTVWTALRDRVGSFSEFLFSMMYHFVLIVVVGL